MDKEKRNISFSKSQNAKHSNPGINFCLAIGIDDYENCPTLQNAVRDIKDFTGLLTQKYGFEKKISSA